MIRHLETREFVKRHNPKVLSKSDRQKKVAQTVKRLREIQVCDKPDKERIDMLIDEIIDLTAAL